MDFRELLDEHLPKIKWLVHKISRGRGGQTELDALISAGKVALWQSSERWDPSVSPDLWKYAHSRVKGAMLDELRQLDQLSRTAREKIKRDEVGELQWALLKPCDMDNAINVPSHSNPERECHEGIQRDVIRAQIEKLPPRLQMIVRMHFLEDEFLADIGRQMGITESRVCQLKGEALRLMRDQMSNDEHFEDGVPGDLPGQPRGPRPGRLELTHAGKTMSVREWATETGLSVASLYSRLNQGWPVEKVLTTPIRGTKKDEDLIQAAPAPDQRSLVPPPLLLGAVQAVGANPAPADEPEEISEVRRRCRRLDEIDAQIRALQTERWAILDCLKPLVPKQTREG